MNMDRNSSPHKVVTRFAPSPTGFLHVGSARTALYAYLWAKKNGGDFILRIEDTDKAREVPGSVEHLQESLRWLGIEWDYGPDKPGPFGSCIQSERLPIYLDYAKQLINKGLAYPDPYTEEEIAAFREQAKVEKRPFLFRDHRPDTFETWDGTKPLRLKVPEVKRYTWQDAVRGELSAGEEMVDDIILIKSDGYPTYNFAHIIDDLEMGVTHIMRGDEFISSQPKFLSIYDALGIPYPVFVTLPPILRDDRTKKLGKRDGAKDILEYRTEGYLPEAMINFLALIGWNPGTDQEIFTRDELVAAFDITKIQRAGGAFNEEKLLWMNKQHLGQLTEADRVAYITSFLPETLKTLPQYSEERVHRLIPTILERVHVGEEIETAATTGEYDFAFVAPTYEKALLKWKSDTSESDALPRLQKVLELLSSTDFTSTDTIKAALWSYAEETGKGEVLWPTRVALSGKERSPDPFTLAYILGREETLTRLAAACAKITG
jgi:glutamyl-tRNA synthetase